jgi:hypothetical protein
MCLRFKESIAHKEKHESEAAGECLFSYDVELYENSVIDSNRFLPFASESNDGPAMYQDKDLARRMLVKIC